MLPTTRRLFTGVLLIGVYQCVFVRLCREKNRQGCAILPGGVLRDIWALIFVPKRHLHFRPGWYIFVYIYMYVLGALMLHAACYVRDSPRRSVRRKHRSRKPHRIRGGPADDVVREIHLVRLTECQRTVSASPAREAGVATSQHITGGRNARAMVKPGQKRR